MIELGARGGAHMVVTVDDTAIAMRSGDVPVAATPRVIALLEEATCAAIRGRLGSHETSVGAEIDIIHRRPTPIGASIMAHAQVAVVDGARIVFDVQADHVTADGDEVQDVARGRITRVIVDKNVFLD